MQREYLIVLFAIGCVFLAIPLLLLNPTSGPLPLGLPVVLITFVLAYATYDVKVLLNAGKNKTAARFVIVLFLSIIFSIIISIIITVASFPYFYPHPML